jgi:23S rRNA (uracil1939-C5)-methyltransferase
VIDPPRAGADSQVKQLAESLVPTVIYISCNPETFARDAKTLENGGYSLQAAYPIDQFLWSAHLEVVGVFKKLWFG